MAIIWSGDFETGDFTQWKLIPSGANYSQVPEYGRPLDGGGDGSLLAIVTNPVRSGSYAAKFVVKNSINGTEPDDCCHIGCDRRRTEVTMHSNLQAIYDGFPNMAERWMSISFFVPSDWDEGGTGWGPTIFQLQPVTNPSSPPLAITLKGTTWRIEHRFLDVEGETYVPWQRTILYDTNLPAADGSDWMAAHLADFPNIATSQAMLGNINKGGWTDFLFHILADYRYPAENGVGFLKLWMRSGSGDWVSVLHITPKTYTVSGVSYGQGIVFNHPDGYGVKSGLYMEKSQAWPLSNNRVIYSDNMRVGDDTETFESMVSLMTDPVSANPYADHARFRFLAGAINSDSLGDNDLSLPGSPENPTIDYSWYMDGFTSAKFVRSSGQYMFRNDVDLAAGFPLRSADGLSAVKTFSCTGWIRMGHLNGGTNLGMIVSKYRAVTGGRSFQVGNNSSDLLTLWLGYNNGDSFDQRSHGTTLTNDTVYFFCVSYDDAGIDHPLSIRIRDKYGNIVGADIETDMSGATLFDGIHVTDEPFTLGCRWAGEGGDNFFDGNMNDIHFHPDKVFTSDEATIFARRYTRSGIVMMV